ncbi:YqjF family protein [Spirosoma utsteinense]|uniref:DUF2071 domain-containing protein n=1 Tax=Spirosoma utsteinense TaxID=2585773 RepID=A0ABR6WDD6_9BACT|nr:DUF2071 domain-containing protein [Spirosoma utsteinense]MBC3788076.1 hypothetical protein [Spirosoma utsteinense]MBC3793961.1 hypothetical protein [Spirosoma utsteinense]
MAFTFLTAEWRNLIFANYPIDRQVLEPLVPYGTELDEYDGQCYGSLVGFYFQRVKLFGKLAVPFHQQFEEFNLRFYVRRKTDTGWKRGVVFVKEIVPKFAITLVANTLYGEPYATHPMRHSWRQTGDTQAIQYDWKVGSDWNHIRVHADRVGHALVADSEEAFITEHYWGYTKRGEGRTSEYEVVHPQWSIYPVRDYAIHCDVEKLYGAAFAPYFDQSPASIFLADGSAVAIKSGAGFS